MAEFVMKDLVKKAGLEGQFHIESVATSIKVNGDPVSPLACRKLAEHGIDCSGKTARQLQNSDYDWFDFLIGMDQTSMRNMYRICGGDYDGKMRLLMDFTDRLGTEVDVQVYDFQQTWDDVLAGCEGLLESLR